MKLYNTIRTYRTWHHLAMICWRLFASVERPPRAACLTCLAMAISVCVCVWVGGNSLMEIEDSRCELVFVAWRQFANQTECRQKGKLNSYEVSTFGIQCKSFKLKMRSRHTHKHTHTCVCYTHRHTYSVAQYELWLWLEISVGLEKSEKWLWRIPAQSRSDGTWWHASFVEELMALIHFHLTFPLSFISCDATDYI